MHPRDDESCSSNEQQRQRGYSNRHLAAAILRRAAKALACQQSSGMQRALSLLK